MVVMSEVDRRWIWFSSRISKVEMSTNLFDDKVFCIDMMVDVVDRNSHMFDSCRDCFGLQNIYTRLTVLVEWEGTYVSRWKAEELADRLKEDTTFCCIGGTPGLSFNRVKGNNFLLRGFPVYCDAIDESEEVVAGASGTKITSMVSVDNEYETVGKGDGFELGCIKIDA